MLSNSLTQVDFEAYQQALRAKAQDHDDLMVEKSLCKIMIDLFTRYQLCEVINTDRQIRDALQAEGYLI